MTWWTRCDGCKRSGKPLPKPCRCRDVTRARCGLRSRPPPMRYLLHGMRRARRRKRNSAHGSRRAKRSSSAWSRSPSPVLRRISSVRWLKPIPPGAPAPKLPRPQAARLDARYRAARDAATKRLGELATRVASALRCAHREDGALPRARSGAGFGSRNHGRTGIGSGSPLERRRESPRSLESQAGSAFPRDDLPRPVPRQLPARLEVRQEFGEGLPDTLLNLEVACGIESPAEFLAARQHLKIRALKNAMEGRQTTVTTPADIERWLLDAAATPRPDEVSRERLAKVIAAVRLRRPG